MSSKNLKTRNRILNAAWRLLEIDQGEIVRMSDIAREAKISRQALYLHFQTRAELLIETTRHVERCKLIDERLAASRNALSGVERLDAFIDAWGNFIPEIYSVAKALLAVKDSDEAAGLAWDNRMQAVREGCEAAVRMLKEDAMLTSQYTPKQASDVLWMLLSVQNWAQLTGDCGWSQSQYISAIKIIARQTLLSVQPETLRDGNSE